MEERLIKNIINLIKENDVDILEKLLKKHQKQIDLNEYHYLNGQNITFLGLAVVMQNYESAQLLIKKGASLNCYIENDTVPIYIARNKIKACYNLLIYNVFDDTMLTLDNLDCFFSIVIKTNNEFLIEKTKNFINHETLNEKNQSLLWFAANYNNIHLIDFFIRKNLDPYRADDDGIAPIRMLIRNDVKLKLYRHDYHDNHNNNLLMIALQENNLEFAKLMLIDYEDYRFYNDQGVTVLELMIKKLDPDYIKLLYWQKPEIFLFLKPMQTIVSQLIKKDLEKIVINMLSEYEHKININKFIKATVENDNLEVFNYIRPKYIIEFEEEFGLLEEIVKNHAISILIHLISQKILLNQYHSKRKTIEALAKVMGNERMMKLIETINS